jgi:hypothetical protein
MKARVSLDLYEIEMLDVIYEEYNATTRSPTSYLYSHTLLFYILFDPSTNSRKEIFPEECPRTTSAPQTAT